ncbi:MAG: carboxypeptidase regulatory-like domain-containing protein, partial [Acidobacteriota bacterium]
RDPDGHPWVHGLSDPERNLQIAARAADAEGRWSHAGLAARRYQHIVTGESLGRVRAETFDLASDATALPIVLDLITIDGTLTLGDAPLAAQVFFGGQRGMTSLMMKADDEGRFGGIVPRGGDWLVEIVSAEPRIARKIAGVAVAPAADGVATVDIALENRVVRGRVLGADGEPLRDARVQVMLAEQTEKPQLNAQMLDPEGTFAFAGLDDGQYVVQALEPRRGGMAQSAPSRVAVSAQAPEVEVDLQITPMRSVRGVVRAPVGPIAGARVYGDLRDASDLSTSVMVPPQTQSDVNGSFTLEVPAHAELGALVIEAPGLVRQRRPLRAGETEIAVDLRMDGGTLLLDVGPPIRGAEPVLISNDGRDALSALRNWATRNGVHIDYAGESPLRVPHMPPGPYALCTGPERFQHTLAALDDATCAVGVLLAGGTLALQPAGRESSTDEKLEDDQP